MQRPDEDDQCCECAVTRPYGAALHKGKLYVGDSRAAGVAVFDLAQRKFYVIEGTGADGRMVVKTGEDMVGGDYSVGV